MRPTKTLKKFNFQFLTKLPSDIYHKALFSLAMLAFLAILFWYGAPLLSISSNMPLAQTDRRAYVIAALFLLGLLKIILLDFDIPTQVSITDPRTQKRLHALQRRFNGAIQFMKKTRITRHGKSTKLNQLPWYLLIGPTSAGKTTLMARSNVDFILQKQFQSQDLTCLTASETCDWWITRDVSIIDVPGKYITPTPPAKPTDKPSRETTLWRYFLRLIKQFRGKHGIDGIIIALPLPELMKQNNTKQYNALLRNLFQRLFEIKKMFPYSIPCQLVITKCDTLAGFKEFFADSTNDEITQAWGISLRPSKPNEPLEDIFAHRFNALIKKLNQQLLWRLHHERNPMARPYIKDFPLQIERMKAFTQDFIKKLVGAHFNLSLQGVYLTSALQEEQKPNTTVIDEAINTSQRTLQLFKDHNATSRAYFIKQFIHHGFALPQPHKFNVIKYFFSKSSWLKTTTYTVATALVCASALLFGHDFKRGVERVHVVQAKFLNYKSSIKQIQDPSDHLTKTVELLDSLQQTSNGELTAADISSVVSFYTDRSKQKAILAYKQALQTILLPEVRNYLTDYLKSPVNHNADMVYGALKAYLMLGDASHFDAGFIKTALQQILPSSLSVQTMQHLLQHINTALSSAWTPQTLDVSLVQESRRYFSMTQSLPLSYIILKNIDTNNALDTINLGASNAPGSALVSQQAATQIPDMFTVKAFTKIIPQELSIAAQEAILGNWVLGEHAMMSIDPTQMEALLEQLRITYITSYVGTWERLVGNMQLNVPANLQQIDELITALTMRNSPLMQFLQTLHENTYFDPIATSSPKLLNLGQMLDKTQPAQTAALYQAFNSLEALHRYLQPILASGNEKKAAFEAASNHMMHNNGPDVLTQLFLTAEQCPDPIKTWLNNIGNYTWHFLMQDAGHYLDFSWKEHVGHLYAAEIANRYPFNPNSDKEVRLDTFAKFFGNPGIIMNFYKTYLEAFVDTSHNEWHWKKINNQRLPLADDTLHQIQHAFHIHQAFFPHGDNKLQVQFALQPYRLGKDVKNVKFSIDNKFTIDEHGGHLPHVFTWPSTYKYGRAAFQLTFSNQHIIGRRYEGNWGWHRLLIQSFESINTKKEVLLNLSMNDHTAKYLFLTQEKNNPFAALNMQHFHLPQQLTDRNI